MALAGISSKLRSVLQLKTLLPASSTAIPLLAVDSLALHPCILLPSSESEPTPELDSVAERLANGTTISAPFIRNEIVLNIINISNLVSTGTGAHLILARPHEPNDARLLDHLALLAHHLKLSPDETSTMRGRQRKVGGFGIGANASLMLDLASVIQSDPLRGMAVI